MYVAMCPLVQVSTEVRGIGSPGAEVTGSQELPDMDAEYQTRILCKGHLSC